MKSKSNIKSSETKEACQKALNQAIRFAKEGADLAMEAAIEEGRHLAKEAGIRLSEKLIQEIKRNGYQNAYRVALTETRQFAENGNITMMKVSLDNLREFAKKSNISIKENFIQEIRILAYKNAYRVALKEATEFAQVSKTAILGSTLLKNTTKYIRIPIHVLQQTVLGIFRDLMSPAKLGS